MESRRLHGQKKNDGKKEEKSEDKKNEFEIYQIICLRHTKIRYANYRAKIYKTL